MIASNISANYRTGLIQQINYEANDENVLVRYFEYS